MPASKTRLLSAAQAAACNTFRVGKESKRGKFGPKRREEVKAVRRKRACLRCGLLRIACSHHDICLPCQQLALVLHAHEKQTLSFSGCIRTMPSEVSIWKTFLTSHESQDVLIAMNQELAMATISLEFSTAVTWNLGRLVDDVVHWLNHPMLSETSKVGILSSPQFLDLVKPTVEEDVTDFHCMIYAISLAYTEPTAPDRHHLNIPELLQIGSMAGHRFLKSLDKRLKPQHLKDCSGDELRSLFLLVIGTILAVGYTDPSASSKDSQDGAQFKAMQSFLCQILAHYVIYLGSQLEHRIASGADQFILQAAPARWHKQGLFQWRTAPGELPESPPGLDLEQGPAFGDSDDHLHALEAVNPSSPVTIHLDCCSAGRNCQCRSKLPVPFSKYESGHSLWDDSRSDEPFSAWQQRGCEERVPQSELYGHTVKISPHSPYHDGKHPAQVKKPRYSIASFSLEEGRPNVCRPERLKFNPEQRLKVATIRRRGSCIRCQSMRTSSISFSKDLCQHCSSRSLVSLLAYEKPILSFIPIRTLIPEGLIFSSSEDQSLCEICRRITASIEERRLLV